MEGAEPKMPGAPGGIQIMTPQQFVAKAGDMPGEESEEGVAEGLTDNDIVRTAYMYGLKHGREGVGNNMDRAKAEWGDNFKHYNAGFLKGRNEKSKGLKAAGQGYGRKQQGVAEGSLDDIEDTKQFRDAVALAKTQKAIRQAKYGKDTKFYADGTPHTPKEVARRAAERKARQQGMTEGHADQQRNVFKKNGEPVGEVGIDRESSPGVGQWYMKCYAYDIDNAGYDSYEEAVAELKHCLKQGVAEGSGKNVVKSVKVGNFRHDLVNTGMGWQVRIYNGDELYDTGLSKNSEQKGLVALDDAVAYTKKQLNIKDQGVAEGYDDPYDQGFSDGYNGNRKRNPFPLRSKEAEEYDEGWFEGLGEYEKMNPDLDEGVAEGSDYSEEPNLSKMSVDELKNHIEELTNAAAEMFGMERSYIRMDIDKAKSMLRRKLKQAVAEGLEHLNRIRKLSGLEEATKLPAQSREFGGQEFQDYMNRIVGTPDVDKQGNVKTDKKGNEKYVSGKTKSDRYKMPYIHRSSVVSYLSPDGKTYDEDAVKKTLAIRPKALLKQNEKMKHSNGEFEQFFNVGFAALTGIALDEQTNNLIIVNTCPGAGSCKVDCFAMKGGKVQFQGPWQSDGRILTYLLNDPDGFFNQLSAEITKESVAGKKGDKKFPNGWQTTVRWHDAGDFFSPEYLDMALKMAAKHPDVKFYAYTKMAGAALAQKPPNFIINWSEGANTSQEKQVKAKDANLDTTKNSRIVPDDLFQDLLVKDEKKNLVKGASGQWQVQPDKLPELKQRLASEYGLSANSILSYDEYMAKRKSIPQGMKYNVIVAPGEGDISANDPNIISTLLLRH